jgi:hypothetical protein
MAGRGAAALLRPALELAAASRGGCGAGVLQRRALCRRALQKYPAPRRACSMPPRPAHTPGRLALALRAGTAGAMLLAGFLAARRGGGGGGGSGGEGGGGGGGGGDEDGEGDRARAERWEAAALAVPLALDVKGILISLCIFGFSHRCESHSTPVRHSTPVQVLPAPAAAQRTRAVRLGFGDFGRIVSSFVRPPIHFTPALLPDGVTLFLKRQGDRALGAAARAALGGRGRLAMGGEVILICIPVYFIRDSPTKHAGRRENDFTARGEVEALLAAVEVLRPTVGRFARDAAGVPQVRATAPHHHPGRGAARPTTRGHKRTII